MHVISPSERKRFSLGRIVTADVMAAAILTLLLQVELWAAQDIRGPRILVVVAGLLMTGALALRRQRPLLALCVTAAAFLVQEFISGALSDLVIPIVAVVVAIYSATAHGSARSRFATGVLGLATTSISVWLDEGGADASSLLYATIVALAAWGAGLVVWQRDRRVTALQAQTEDLARQRDEAARRAVEEERSRLARELHDVIAHSVSVMRIQAAAAEEVFDDKPERVREALHSIQLVGREAMTDMRRLLLLLRSDEGESPLKPQPELEDLSTLFDQARSAGLPVSLNVKGEERPLPAVVQLCAYRIIQESLTNALKHSGPAEAQVLIAYLDRELVVEVRDSGRGPQHGAKGHGLMGMRERVALLGGRFHAGAGDGGGFTVRAHLPLDADEELG